MEQIADLLIGVSALRQRVSALEAASLAQSIASLNRVVCAREQACVQRLLSLYRFYPDDVETAALPLLDGRWQLDAFDPLLLQTMGTRVGGGAAAGAAAGAGIDLMVGGLTLGAAAVIGALLGGGLQTLRHYGSSLLGKLTGEKNLRVDNNILLVLASRQCELILALERRGHAAQHRQTGSQALLPVFPDNVLPTPIRLARANPGWALDEAVSMGNEARQEALLTLSQALNNVMVGLRQN
jgi:hypothetical protein